MKTPSAPIEAGVRRRARRNLVRDTLLATIAAVPLLAVAMAAPKVLSAIDPNLLDRVLPSDPRQRIRENLSRLKRKGLIRVDERVGKKVLALTQAGERELRRLQSSSLTIRKPRRWDRRWRVVIFDVAENRRSKRDTIRRLLKSLGFLRLQDSVWVYPYDCEDVVTLLKTDLRVGRELLYLVADAVEYDLPLRQHFELPLAD